MYITRETSIRCLVCQTEMHEIAEVVEEVTDIAKIVRKKIRFWILQTKPLKSRTCKECEKKKRY